MNEFRRIDEEQLNKLKNQMAFEIKMRKKREQEEKE
jgi:hypothetical protein